jgi:trehalose 6-phosphate phosphatase
VKARIPKSLGQRLARASKLWLFLDYDGTLAEFAPTPEHVDPDPDLIELLNRLAGQARLRIAVISGRRLSHVQSLVPVPGVLLAGTYGVELQLPGGEQVERVAYTTVRPVLDSLKPGWEHLLAGGEGFFLEDKGWALALHARFADEDEAEKVLGAAHQMATRVAASGPFRVLGGHRFLEVGPKLAHKGLTVAYLLESYPWPGALPIYVGDDDKDEEAFGVIQAYAGIAILVSRESRNTGADFRLESPRVVRHWLEGVSEDWGE